MSVDSLMGQVISLSAKRLVKDVPAPNGGDAVLRDVLSNSPAEEAERRQRILDKLRLMSDDD